MRRKRIGTGLAVIALVSVAATLQAGEAPLTPRQSEGKKAFHTHCAYCHLEGGTGTFMLGRRLGEGNALLEKRTNLDPAYVRAVVRTGIVSMPPITRIEVTDEELDAIATYLSRANGAQAAAASERAQR